MTQASHNQRKKQRTKRINEVLRRELQRTVLSNYKLFSTFMMVLAQKGGEVTITKGTAEQVLASMDRLAYVVEPGATDNEFIIRQTLKEDTYVSIDDSAEIVADPTPESERVLSAVQPDSDDTNLG